MQHQDTLEEIRTGRILRNFDQRLVLGLSIVGGLYLLKTSSTWISSFCKYFLRPSKDLKTRYGGGWALITGASDGIGKAYALEFAKRGFDIILVGRNEEKTRGVEQEIKAQSKVRTKVILFDFNIPYDEKKYNDAFVQALENYDISILVNNVGSARGDLIENMPINKITEQIYINTIPAAILCRLIIPKMLKRSTKSGIMNLSSIYHEMMPYGVSLYNATKSFMHSLSVTISKEHPDKIDVLAVLPAAVLSSMMTNKNFPLLIMPNEHAKHTIDKLGWDVETYGHPHHALFMSIFRTPILGYLLVSKIKKDMVEALNRRNAAMAHNS